MKNILSDFGVSALSRDDLKQIKGGTDNCGQCLLVSGEIKDCKKSGKTDLCACPGGTANNLCG